MIKYKHRDLAVTEADKLTADYSSPPIPVREIAEMNGVNVVFAKFGQFNDVMAGFCDFSAHKLYVNADDALPRQSFTISHELGHWLLHSEYFVANPDKYQVLPRFETPDNSDTKEKEANKFAAHLLVPTRLLLPVREAPVSTLARVFMVSRVMMEFRIKNVCSKKSQGLFFFECCASAHE